MNARPPARLGRGIVTWALAVLPLLHQLGLQRVPTTSRWAIALGLTAGTVGGCADVATARRTARVATALGAALVVVRWGLPATADGVAISLALVAAVAAVAAAEAVDGPGGERIAARAGSAAGPFLVVAAAVASADGWLTVRNFVPLACTVWAVAVVATGAAGVGGPARRPGRASAVLFPLVAADAVLWARAGLIVPVAILALPSLAVAALALRPGWWSPVERTLGPAILPVDRLLDALDRGAAQLARPFLALSHRSWTVLGVVFRWVGRALSALLLTIAWVALVAIPWAVQRLVRWDPLAAPTRSGSRWVPLVPVSTTPERTWAPDLADPERRRVLGRRRLISVVGGAAIVALVWVALPADEPATDTASPALDVADQADLDAAMAKAMASAVVRQYAGTELPDVDSEFLHIADGVRGSWEPPRRACDGLVRVWLFGGSTAFGIAQADDRTIASHLARQAWMDGIPLAIENRAVPGDVSWQEHARLQRALATSGTPPDLVVFYDGFNDFLAQDWATGFHEGGVGTFRSLIDADLMPLLSHVEQRSSRGKKTYTATIDRPNHTRSDYAESVPATAFQYRQADAWSRTTLTARGIPMVRFFQPSKYTAGRRASDGNTRWNPTAVRALADLRTDLPDGVVDIADVLDDVPGDIFLDAVHTRDTVNPVIARAMFGTLRTQLAALHRAKESSCS